MRALKAILTAAGNLKRIINQSEEVICLQALMDVNVPKFTLNDVPLFMSIIVDLFPGVEEMENQESEFKNTLRQKTVENKLVAKDSFIKKCI